MITVLPSGLKNVCVANLLPEHQIHLGAQGQAKMLLAADSDNARCKEE